MSDKPLEPWQWPDHTWRGIVDKVRAGRSLAPASWPGGARCAVALSFDSDHETIELRNGGKSLGKISQGQYGGRRGSPRILDCLARHGVPASFFMPAVAAMLHPDEPRRVIAEGHELAIHSWIHELNGPLGYDAERDLTYRAADVLEKLSGVRPDGMRTASWDFSPHTLRIVREMGLLYDSSLMGDDEPYELLEEGQETGVVELPVEWIRDDAVYFNMDRASSLRPYTSPDAVLSIFMHEFEAAYREKGLFLLTMHPHHSGHRSRIFILEEVIRLAKAKGDVWFATHADIARHCAEAAGLKTAASRS